MSQRHHQEPTAPRPRPRGISRAEAAWQAAQSAEVHARTDQRLPVVDAVL